ncbi:MAG: hypothetical protein KAG61_12355 [Bacteriovoracaceae bacterium]|nr:hypothetical protein [Bacteriovoracaceae bacterium]
MQNNKIEQKVKVIETELADELQKEIDSTLNKFERTVKDRLISEALASDVILPNLLIRIKGKVRL